MSKKELLKRIELLEQRCADTEKILANTGINFLNYGGENVAKESSVCELLGAVSTLQFDLHKFGLYTDKFKRDEKVRNVVEDISNLRSLIEDTQEEFNALLLKLKLEVDYVPEHVEIKKA